MAGRVVKLLHRESASHWPRDPPQQSDCRGGYLASHSLGKMGMGQASESGNGSSSFSTCHDKITHSGTVKHGPSEKLEYFVLCAIISLSCMLLCFTNQC